MVKTGKENKNSFIKFQFTALIATAVDFIVTIILKEKLNIHYSWAVAGGATTGAITAFTINRQWVFKSLSEHPVTQGFRYFLVATGSVILNTMGTYFITESFHAPYLVSKALVALVIGFTYSYYFSKRFVFYA
jgi:putative flippase GtrA